MLNARSGRSDNVSPTARVSDRNAYQLPEIPKVAATTFPIPRTQNSIRIFVSEAVKDVPGGSETSLIGLVRINLRYICGTVI